MLRRDIREAAVAGLACALLGVLASGVFTLGRSPLVTTGFVAMAGCAGFVSATAVWWMLVAQRPAATRRRGALAGGLAVLFAHLVTFELFAAGQLVAGPASTFDDILKSLVFAILFGVVSLAIVGWLTVPLGALLGAYFVPRRTA